MTDTLPPPGAALPMISLRGVGKSFGSHRVLAGIDLDIARGEVVTLIGPSGSGKTTLLRCMNFLDAYDEGEVQIRGALLGYRRNGAGALVRDSDRAVAEVRAPLAMVFQHFNLWPHMTVLANVMAPLTLARAKPAAQARQIALQALDRVGLADKAGMLPARLSGGQQQRVGIARALAVSPEAMLLDEPTSALDPELVDEVLAVIQSLSREGMTMVMVTHEMSFAAEVSDRIVFMEQGRILATGSAEEIIRRPSHPRIRSFLQPWIRRSLALPAGDDDARG
ncbi:amino acid ABC transporter ATP-binding protein [Bordetella bronchialis]|uniref:ATP-binding protein n=1 Tax=Bordetella bronchialis TaxID=463025 RepID=A0ABM6D0A8_9BORD|nr:amino acid ABC transporter ATP-binding protein [Bordetella bronchialis]ANN69877.1 ATP-binding protein [Bordetella bronchialis]